MSGVSDRITPELEARFSSHPELISKTKNFIRTLGNAPVILLAFLLRDDYADPKTALISVSAAVENVILAARDLGIASCWLTAADQTGFGPLIQKQFARERASWLPPLPSDIQTYGRRKFRAVKTAL